VRHRHATQEVSVVTLLYIIGVILFVLGIIGFFTHLVGLGIGAIIVGAVIILVCRFAIGPRGGAAL
jgi:hypothetical protein